MAPIFALSFDKWYCNTTRPGNLPSFSATVMRSLSSVVVEGMVIGAFAPSGRQTTPGMSKANTERIVSYILSFKLAGHSRTLTTR